MAKLVFAGLVFANLVFNNQAHNFRHGCINFQANEAAGQSRENNGWMIGTAAPVGFA